MQNIMNSAIITAFANVGLTGENPSVCAIATDAIFNIIATATTSPHGRPHAEQNLISDLLQKQDTLDKKFTNLKLFSTLEPCSHQGKTPPCANLILDSKMFSEVYISYKDPDKRVNGLGINTLQRGGLSVFTDILSDKSYEMLYKEYSFAKLNESPFVTIKIACSIDGKIATSTASSKWISAAGTRQYTNFLRSKFDGILIGSRTYLQDKPSLTCRTAGLEEHSPKRFILSNTIKKADNFNVINGNNIHQSLRSIYKHGVNHLLVEGGATVITSLIKQDLVNRFIICLSPLFIGADGIDSLSSLNTHDINSIKRLKLIETKKIGDDIIAIYELP